MTNPSPMTVAELRAYDANAIANGTPGIVLMETAGRKASLFLISLKIAGPVTIVCGKGNNAGDGFVVARHLALAGYDARLELLAGPNELQGDALLAYQSLAHLNLPIHRVESPPGNAFRARLADSDWLVDALLGTGSHGTPRPPLDQIIDLMNASNKKILALDLPSGLDADTGQPAPSTIIATRTVTFVAPKVGFQKPAARDKTGPVHVVTILPE